MTHHQHPSEIETFHHPFFTMHVRYVQLPITRLYTYESKFSADCIALIVSNVVSCFIRCRNTRTCDTRSLFAWHFAFVNASPIPCFLLCSGCARCALCAAGWGFINSARCALCAAGWGFINSVRCAWCNCARVALAICLNPETFATRSKLQRKVPACRDTSVLVWASASASARGGSPGRARLWRCRRW